MSVSYCYNSQCSNSKMLIWHFCVPWNERSGQDNRSFGPRNAYVRIGGPRELHSILLKPWMNRFWCQSARVVCWAVAWNG